MSIILDGTNGIQSVTGSYALAVAGPAFSATQTTPQSIGGSTVTKVTFQTEQFDTNNNFAASSFTPTVAGYYQINCLVSYSGITVAYPVTANIFKNSALYIGSLGYGGSGGADANIASLVYLNGTTDFVEIYSGQYSPSSQNIDSAYFNGALVRAA